MAENNATAEETSLKGEPMTTATCEVTKFPVAMEFKRRAVRRCFCQACETYAGMMTCEPVLQPRPVASHALMAA